MRYLVVVDHTLGGTGLTWSLYNHTLEAREDEGTNVRVLVPAAENESATAAARLAAELDNLQSAGIEASGEVSAEDPIEAIRAAMADHWYDGILIATHPVGLSRWLHLDLPHRVEREFQVPVEWIEAKTDDLTEDTTVHIELPREAMMNLSDQTAPRADLT